MSLLLTSEISPEAVWKTPLDLKLRAMKKSLFALSLLQVALLSHSSFNVLGATKDESANTDDWHITDTNGNCCVRLKAEITLGISYYRSTDGAMITDVTVAVPGNATTDEGSSCDSTDIIENVAINAQIIRLTFEKEKYPGWYVEFAFTSDRYFGLSREQYAMYSATVSANYSSMPDKFPNANGSAHIYKQSLNPHGDPPELAKEVYANEDYSFYCPSKQRFMIAQNDSAGPSAWIQFRYLQLQAYMTSCSFSKKQTCRMDDHKGDLAYVIVGSVLAGLVVTLLVAYLLYRWRHPPKMVTLPNPHSHVEELGGHDKEAARIEEVAEHDVPEERKSTSIKNNEDGITNSSLLKRHELKRADFKDEKEDLAN